jgi:hypothetical protein
VKTSGAISGSPALCQAVMLAGIAPLLTAIAVRFNAVPIEISRPPGRRRFSQRHATANAYVARWIRTETADGIRGPRNPNSTICVASANQISQR